MSFFQLIFTSFSPFFSHFSKMTEMLEVLSYRKIEQHPKQHGQLSQTIIKGPYERLACHLMLLPVCIMWKQLNTVVWVTIQAIKIFAMSQFRSTSIYIYIYILHVWYNIHMYSSCLILTTKLNICYFSHMHLDILFIFVSLMFYF